MTEKTITPEKDNTVRLPLLVTDQEEASQSGRDGE